MNARLLELHLRRFLGVAGRDDDRQLRVDRAQSSGRLEPVDPRHLVVGNDQIVRSLLQSLERRETVVDGGNVEAGIGELNASTSRMSRSSSATTRGVVLQRSWHIARSNVATAVAPPTGVSTPSCMTQEKDCSAGL